MAEQDTDMTGAGSGFWLPWAVDYSPFAHVLKASAKAQLEAVKFCTDRGQAYLDLPKKLAGCRSAHDLLTIQTAFYQAATERYTDCCARMLDAWMPPSSGGQAKPPFRKPARDYITFANRQPVPPRAATAPLSNGAYRSA